MRFTLLSCVAVVSALLLTAMPSVAQKDKNSTANLASEIGDLSPCFLTCAGTAAVSVGCKGLVDDLPCVCASQSFASSTSDCITKSTNATCTSVASNKTALAESNKVFVSICSTISGGSNGTSTNGTKAANGTSSGTAKNGTSASTAGTNVGFAVQPAVSHVATAAALVFSALAIGSATLV